MVNDPEKQNLGEMLQNSLGIARGPLHSIAESGSASESVEFRCEVRQFRSNPSICEYPEVRLRKLLDICEMSSRFLSESFLQTTPDSNLAYEGQGIE